eukprot:1686808-Pyramimonas_sp.AAC.1
MALLFPIQSYCNTQIRLRRYCWEARLNLTISSVLFIRSSVTVLSAHRSLTHRTCHSRVTFDDGSLSYAAQYSLTKSVGVSPALLVPLLTHPDHPGGLLSLVRRPG